MDIVQWVCGVELFQFVHVRTYLIYTDIAEVCFCLQLRKWFISHGNTLYYVNNTAIIISSIMTTDDTSLTCHTGSTTCCRGVDNPVRSTGFGQWLFPNRTEIARPNSIIGSGFYWSRDYQVVRLYRQGDIQTPLGTYCCRIPDNSGVMRTFCTNIIIGELNCS